MQIKRKLYDRLLEWKKVKGQKALLIEGARRIGKSTLAEEFGKREYRACIMVDFNKASKRVLDAFDNMVNLDVFFQTLSLEYATRLYPRESLIVFDEIQKFPKARECIKYLVADGRYDFIETGSLISIRENVETITVALHRNLDKKDKANKVYISKRGTTLWQKKTDRKQRSAAA